MTRVSFGFFVGVILWLTGCGGSDGHNKVTTDHALDIAGVWSSACLSDRNQINQFVFNDNGSMSLTETLFEDQGCEGPSVILVSTGSFILGETLLTDNGAIAVELDLLFIGGDRAGVIQLDIVDQRQSELFFGVFDAASERPTALDYDNPYALKD